MLNTWHIDRKSNTRNICGGESKYFVEIKKTWIKGRTVSYCVFLCVVIGTRIIFFSRNQATVACHTRIGVTWMIMRETRKARSFARQYKFLFYCSLLYHLLSAFNDIKRQGFRVTSGQIFWNVTLEVM